MKILAWINLFGILSLAALCAIQWQVNRNANRTVNALAFTLDKTRQIDAKRIAEQDHTIEGDKVDLTSLHARLERADAARGKAEAQAATLRSERDAANAQRDQTKAAFHQSKENLEKWIAAVHDRDETLKKAIAEINELVKTRDAAIAKFNDLAGKYNAMVKEGAKPAPGR